MSCDGTETVAAFGASLSNVGFVDRNREADDKALNVLLPVKQHHGPEIHGQTVIQFRNIPDDSGSSEMVGHLDTDRLPSCRMQRNPSHQNWPPVAIPAG